MNSPKHSAYIRLTRRGWLAVAILWLGFLWLTAQIPFFWWR